MKVNIQKLKELQNYLVQLEPLKVYDIECKSLPQLYYELAKKINEIIKTVDIFESHNLNIIAEFGEKIDKLLDENLIPELEKIMDDMYESGMLKELVEEVLLQDITERMNKIERVANIAGAERYYYPAQVEDCQLGNNGIPESYAKENYEKFFDWKLNKLVNEFPDYVRKTVEGHDQTGEYPIYRYSFIPKDYDRTILLLGQVHGNEYTSFFSICEFLDRLTRDSLSNNNLTFLREKVKIVAIPIVNPWGFCNQNRRNSRGVDLNRNSSYRWDEYTVTNSLPGEKYFKGDAPFSEAETQVVRGVVESLLNDKLVGSIDMHTITTIQAEKILYYPRFSENIADKYQYIFETMDSETGNDRRILGTSAVPTMSNWMAHQYKIIACNPEWNNSCYDAQGNRTSFNMTKHMEYMTNIILTVAKHNKKAQTNELHPFVKGIVWNVNQCTNEVEDANRDSILGHRLLNPTDNTPSSWNTSKYEFTVNTEGLVLVDGTITLRADNDCTVTICPLLYQKYAPESNFATLDTSDRYWQTFSIKAGGYAIIPILSTVQVYHTNYNDTESRRADIVHFRIKACSDTTNSAYITDMKARITFIPSNMGTSLEIFRATGEMIHETIFPLRIDTYEYED